MEVCKYCNQNEAIENSHQIPKSIYDLIELNRPPIIKSNKKYIFLT
jgi:hypothetical protein